VGANGRQYKWGIKHKLWSLMARKFKSSNQKTRSGEIEEGWTAETQDHPDHGTRKREFPWRLRRNRQRWKKMLFTRSTSASHNYDPSVQHFNHCTLNIHNYFGPQSSQLGLTAGSRIESQIASDESGPVRKRRKAYIIGLWWKLNLLLASYFQMYIDFRVSFAAEEMFTNIFSREWSEIWPETRVYHIWKVSCQLSLSCQYLTCEIDFRKFVLKYAWDVLYTKFRCF